MKPKLVLIGGGGHCASCIDVIELEDKFEIAGIVDIDTCAGSLLGYPVLGNDDTLLELRSSFDFALITIGQITTPSIRIKLFEIAKFYSYTFPKIISPRAYVSGHAEIGEGTIVMHGALINSRASIGRNCIINSQALVEHDAVIEDNCHISTAAIINGGGVVKNGTFVGSNAVTIECIKTNENDFINAGSIFRGYARN